VSERGLAFDYWRNKKDVQGRDALVISDELPDLESLDKYFTRVDREIKRIPLIRHGKTIRHFYLVRCYNYLR
jgi:hypothetical protein